MTDQLLQQLAILFLIVYFSLAVSQGVREVEQKTREEKKDN